MTTKRRFIRLNDTHIQDTHDGNEYYCPCEPLFLDKINQTIEDYKNTIKTDYVHIKRLERQNINTTNTIREAYKNEKNNIRKKRPQTTARKTIKKTFFLLQSNTTTTIYIEYESGK